MFCFREPLTLQINACRLPGLCLPLVYHPCPYAQIQNKPKLWLKKKDIPSCVLNLFWQRHVHRYMSLPVYTQVHAVSPPRMSSPLCSLLRPLLFCLSFFLLYIYNQPVTQFSSISWWQKGRLQLMREEKLGFHDTRQIIRQVKVWKVSKKENADSCADVLYFSELYFLIVSKIKDSWSHNIKEDVLIPCISRDKWKRNKAENTWLPFKSPKQW